MILKANPFSRPTPYEQWLIEAELALLGLEDCKVECDGMTWVISHLMTKFKIPHQCFNGYVKYEQRDKYLAPHYWIQLPLGYICDFRLRMWFGDEDHIPHGMFQPKDAPGFFYKGSPCSPYTLTDSLAQVLTDGAIDFVELPRPPGLQVSHAKKISQVQT